MERLARRVQRVRAVQGHDPDGAAGLNEQLVVRTSCRHAVGHLLLHSVAGIAPVCPVFYIDVDVVDSRARR